MHVNEVIPFLTVHMYPNWEFAYIPGILICAAVAIWIYRYTRLVDSRNVVEVADNRPTMVSAARGDTPRYFAPPCADAVTPSPAGVIQSEHTDPHGWTNCPGWAFDVRHGPSYETNCTKASSADSLYEVFAVSAASSTHKLRHIGRITALQPDVDAVQLGLPPYIIVHMMVPQYPPRSIFYGKRADGPSLQLTVYGRLSHSVRTMIREGCPSPAIALLRRFLDPVAGARLRKERLKLIAGVVDAQHNPGFNLATRALIRAYNYKPFLSKTASSFYATKVRPQRFTLSHPKHAAPCGLRAPTDPPRFLYPQDYFEIDGSSRPSRPATPCLPCRTTAPRSRAAAQPRCALPRRRASRTNRPLCPTSVDLHAWGNVPLAVLHACKVNVNRSVARIASTLGIRASRRAQLLVPRRIRHRHGSPVRTGFHSEDGASFRRCDRGPQRRGTTRADVPLCRPESLRPRHGARSRSCASFLPRQSDQPRTLNAPMPNVNITLVEFE